MRTAPPTRAMALKILRQRLQSQEPHATGLAGEAKGVAALGVGSGELIELRPRAYFDAPAAFSFFAALASSAARESTGPVLWCRRSHDTSNDFGALYPHGLSGWGLDVRRVILAQGEDSSAVLWAMEEGARAQGLAAVLGEPGAGSVYGLTASRRLKLAAEKSGTTLFVLRPFNAADPSAARRRWGVAAAISTPKPWRGATGLPALGPPRWSVIPERGRGQQAGPFEIEWDNETLSFREPAVLADRALVPRRRTKGQQAARS